ncbi:hypothetical protein QFC19_008966 [Naganishia cerealis]|uniref:Uncharacterized protein n=1 Tax=Naganishia cerealis TaxID=610337 RepID=A0ACC2UYP9_9TREE|nr:hypothetical protein QFC19_008966 [Naganishia cerealis]
MTLLRLLLTAVALGLVAAAEQAACIPSGRGTEVLINERFRIAHRTRTNTDDAGECRGLAQGVVAGGRGRAEHGDQSRLLKVPLSNNPLTHRRREPTAPSPRTKGRRTGGDGQRRGTGDPGLQADRAEGPAGEEWDDEYDGSTEAEPRFGNPRADGISLACKDSMVSGNTVFDTTDGAIVLFGSAGSQVMNNQVYARTRMVMGGINMVDYDPWEGDYTGVKVHGNTISGFGGYIKGAINIGQACWTDNTEIMVHGGQVTQNTIEGTGIGYGITVAGAKDVVVKDNKSTAKYGGVRGRECPKAPENAEPCPFLINRGSSEGVFQEEFVNGEVQHVICIEPETDDGEPYKPWRLRDSPLAVATFAEEAVQAGISNGFTDEAMNAALAESLVAYQMEVMAALKAVTDKVARGVAPGRDVQAQGNTAGKSPLSAVLGDLFTRLANLESEKKQVKLSIGQMGKAMERYNARFSEYRDRTKALRRIVSAAKRYQGMESLATLPTSALAMMPHRVRAHNWTPAGAFVLLELAGVAGWSLFRIRQRRSAHERAERGSLTGGRSRGYSTSKPAATMGLFGRKKAVKMV